MSLIKDHRRAEVLSAIVKRARTVLEADPRFLKDWMLPGVSRAAGPFSPLSQRLPRTSFTALLCHYKVLRCW